MKTFMLAAAIALSVSTSTLALQQTPIEAQAKVTKKHMTASLAKTIKKGTLPNAKGKIGMTYKTLEKKAPAYYVGTSDQSLIYYHSRKKVYDGNVLNLDAYFFKQQKFSVSSKIHTVQRLYDYTFTASSLKKYFGKPLNVDGPSATYKAGKYRVLLITEKNQTFLYVYAP